MILWPCASCRSTEYCAHREHDLVVWAVGRAGGREIVPDPLPAQPEISAEKIPTGRMKPPARETRGAVPGIRRRRA